MAELDLLRELSDRIVPPPLDELCETARRRDRRRAGVVAGLTAAVLAAVTVGTWTLTPEDDAAPRPVEPTPSSRPLTYAEGATVHYGDRTVEAAGNVVELDLTDDGVAFRTEDDRIWFTDGARTEQVGALGETGPGYGDGSWPLLVRPSWVLSGNAGSRLVWFEFPAPGRPEVVVYDTAGRTETARGPVDVGAGHRAVPALLSERYVYWYLDPDGGETSQDTAKVRYDPATGEQVPATQRDLFADLNGDAATRSLRTDGDGGLCGGPCRELAYTDGMNQQMGLFLEQGVAGVTGIAPVGAGDMVTEDVAGEPVRFDDLADYPRRGNGPAWLVQWEDDDTLVMVNPRADRTDLIECHLSSHACNLAVSRPGPLVVPEFGTTVFLG